MYQMALTLVLAWLHQMLPEPGEHIDFLFPSQVMIKQGHRTHGAITVKIEYHIPPEVPGADLGGLVYAEPEIEGAAV